MDTNLKTAEKFFEACETGKGWEACKVYCHPDATFSAQAAVLADMKTIEEYTQWWKGMLIPLPDGKYKVRFFAEDKDRQCVVAYAVFHGTQTGPGGPIEPTGRTIVSDYVYAMQFEGNLIQHLTKIWNDAKSLQQFGWG